MHLFRLLPAIFLIAVQAIAQNSIHTAVNSELNTSIVSDYNAFPKQDDFSKYNDVKAEKNISLQICASGGSTLTEYTHRHCLGISDGIDYFSGLTEHPTNDAGFSIGLIFNTDKNLRLSAGIDYDSYRSYGTTDTALINEHKISFGFVPDPQFENTSIYQITGNRISLTAGIEYIFLKKIVVGFNIMHHTLFSPRVRRELYSGEDIVENFPVSFKPSLPSYIPFYYCRMTYEWVLGTEFKINESKSLLFRPELFCQTRGFRFNYWPYVSLAGIRASIVFNLN
jgi:hypothetical protein